MSGEGWSALGEWFHTLGFCLDRMPWALVGHVAARDFGGMFVRAAYDLSPECGPTRETMEACKLVRERQWVEASTGAAELLPWHGPAGPLGPFIDIDFGPSVGPPPAPIPHFRVVDMREIARGEV